MLYLNIVPQLLLWVKCNIFGKGSEWLHFFHFFIFCYKKRGCHACCSSCPKPLWSRRWHSYVLLNTFFIPPEQLLKIDYFKFPYVHLPPSSLTPPSFSSLGHIRCSNPESASRILQLGLLNFDVSLLNGKEEDDYWEKLRLDRESRKRSGNKKKKPNRANNGFKKIVDRALKSPGDVGSAAASAATAPRTHMRFDDDWNNRRKMQDETIR